MGSFYEARDITVQVVGMEGGDPGTGVLRSSCVRAEEGGENTQACIRGQIDVSAWIVPGNHYIYIGAIFTLI